MRLPKPSSLFELVGLLSFLASILWLVNGDSAMATGNAAFSVACLAYGRTCDLRERVARIERRQAKR